MTKRKFKESLRRPWTETEDRLLKSLIERGVDREKIAKKLNRTKAAILTRCRKKRWVQKAGRRWTDNELELVLIYRLQGYSNKEIAEKLDRTPKAIQSVCEKNGWVEAPNRKWKKQDDWMMLDRLEWKELDDIADEFNRSKAAICQRASKLGRRWKDQRWNFTRAAQVLGVSYQTVHRYWKRISYRDRRLTEKGVKEIAQAILDNPHTNLKDSKRIRDVANGIWDGVEVKKDRKRKYTPEEDRIIIDMAIESRLETGLPNLVAVAKKLGRSLNSVQCRYYKLTRGARK